MADEVKINPFLEIGSTGLTRFGGWIYEEWLKDLQGQKAIKIYKEMRDSDPVIGAILFAIKMLIRQASWRVEAGGNTRQDEEAKEFLESCMKDMSHSWHDLITEILSMLVFGWSYHELVFKRRNGDSRDPAQKSKYTDGRIGWRKIPIRAQETFYQWVFDEEDGGIKALKQMPPPDYRIREIPIEKSLLFRTESRKGSPEGVSILRTAYRAWYFKKNIEEIEGIGIERDLAGLPVAYVPLELLNPNATTEQKAVLSLIQRLVTNIRRDETEGVVFPAEELPDGRKTGYKLSLLSTGGRRQFDTTDIIERYDKRIAMTVLADFILLGQDKVGSYALASSKTNMFSLAIGAILDSIQEVFNTYAVPRLFALNSFQGLSGLPVLVHGDVESPDLKELGDYISSLAGAGFNIIDDEVENYLRQVASLPQKPKEGLGKRLYLPARIKQSVDDDRQEFIKAVRELREAVRKAMEV